MLRNREGNLFHTLPMELIYHICEMDNTYSEIHTALKLAASGKNEDILAIVNMIKVDPRLLLQAGNVITRGGVFVIRTTLYEFFIAESDPVSAGKIEFGFASIPNGENERIRQLERIKPDIEAIIKQIKSKQLTFDLRELISIMRASSDEDIKAVLKNDMNHKCMLRDTLIAFRSTVDRKRKGGMHYEHYSTLKQAFDLLYDEIAKYMPNPITRNYEHCDLIWRLVIGYLQRSLPSVDRFAFARAFDDDKRILDYKYCEGAFPDIKPDNREPSGLGFNYAVFGLQTNNHGLIAWGKLHGVIDMYPPWASWRALFGHNFEKHLSNKADELTRLMSLQHLSVVILFSS